MTARNNKAYVEESLCSVLNQDYENYRVIYVDDCSVDGAGEVVRELIEIHPDGWRVTFFANDVRKGKLANLYASIHTLGDQEIVVEVDGDDYLQDNDVFATLNTAYQTTGALVVHGAYENYAQGKIDHSLPIFAQPTPWWVKHWELFRDYPWIYSGVRSYYAGLFKHIAREDLCTKHPQFAGQFFPVSHDTAMFYPMLEMARERVAFIPQPILRRNIDSPINDYKVYSPEVRAALRKEIAEAHRYLKL